MQRVHIPLVVCRATESVCVEECPCVPEAPQSFLDQSSPAEMIEDPTGWMHRNRENDMQMG